MTDANRGRLTMADVDRLDELYPGDILAGYLDGFRGNPWPDKEPSPAYEHGRRNGVNDRNHTVDDDQRILIAEARRLGRL